MREGGREGGFTKWKESFFSWTLNHTPQSQQFKQIVKDTTTALSVCVSVCYCCLTNNKHYYSWKAGPHHLLWMLSVGFFFLWKLFSTNDHNRKVSDPNVLYSILFHKENRSSSVTLAGDWSSCLLSMGVETGVVVSQVWVWQKEMDHLW